MSAITGAALIVLMILLLILSFLNLYYSGWNFDESKIQGIIQIILALLFGIYGAHLLKKSSERS